MIKKVKEKSSNKNIRIKVFAIIKVFTKLSKVNNEEKIRMYHPYEYAKILKRMDYCD